MRSILLDVVAFFSAFALAAGAAAESPRSCGHQAPPSAALQVATGGR